MPVAPLKASWLAGGRVSPTVRHQRRRRLVGPLAVAYCLAGWLSATGGGCGVQYNPGRLPADRIASVAAICVDVMGMTKFEAVGPSWASDDGRPFSGRWENHYQGCIDGLSDTLRDMNVRNTLLHTDEACRLINPAADSVAQAKCVMAAANTDGRLIDLAMADKTRGAAIARSTGPQLRPFYTVPQSEKVRREQSACADIGLNPAFGGFAACVSHLANIFYVIDNPLH